MKFGERLKELRTKSNLTQEELAKEMGITSKTIGRWEKEDNIPDKEKLKKLCKALKCNVSDLTGEEKKVSKPKKKVNETIESVKETKEEVKEEIAPLKEEIVAEKKEEPVTEDSKKIAPVIVPLEKEEVNIPEAKEEKVKVKTFGKGDRRCIHGLSKAVNIIARILQVFMVLGMIGVAIVMVCIPALFNRIDIYDNMIRFEVGRDALILKEDDNGISLNYNDDQIFNGSISKEFHDTQIVNIFKTNSKPAIVWHIEILLFIGIVSLIILYLVLGYLARLMKNIHGDEIFTLANVSLFRKIGYLLISIIVLSNVSGLVITNFVNSSFTLNCNLEDVIIILVMLLLAHIFKYGYSLESLKNE